ncbi:MAG: hypothetical protein HLX51_02575 [Micrococcaceae bacterium]|nr:hypothetical protein [Micrococcaceae bacterium]
MDFGSLADWVGAIGGFLAAFAAVVAWRVNRRMLTVEQQRDEQQEARQRYENYIEKREQAGLVFSLGAKLPERDNDESWAIYLFNGSAKPVYNVRVESRRLDDSRANYPLEIGALPPGRWVVPSHPKFHWSSLVDLSLTPEPVNFLVKGKARGMITSMTFKDAAGEQWHLDSGTTISE